MLIARNHAINAVFRALRKIGAASRCGRGERDGNGAGRAHENGARKGRGKEGEGVRKDSANERMVKGREGEGRAALYARMQ